MKVRKMSRRQLRNLVLKEMKNFKRTRKLSHLNETKAAGSAVGDSVDAQIDRLLVSYEKTSKSMKQESLDLRFMTLLFLNEASEEGKKASDLDVEEFAGNVARLIDNYDSLLETRNVILRRAINFVSKVYDDETTEGLKEALRTQYDLEIGKQEADSDIEFQPPKAGEAGPL